VALTAALNRAYDIEEASPWWKVRVTAILTIGLAMFVLCAFTLVVAGPDLGEAAAYRFGMGSVFMWAWSILQCFDGYSSLEQRMSGAKLVHDATYVAGCPERRSRRRAGGGV
jgi:O-antigen/teichoic acid export membrane protein